MNVEQLLVEAKELLPKMQKNRRNLHKHPELGFDLAYTKEYVKKALYEIGLEPIEMGRAGVITLVGGKKEGKCVLLRADMDALPMEEEADVTFRSENPGKMHACGHDMHTAMLLGAAEILKKHESEIQGVIKLEFQPAEEIFRGSKDMLEAGLLNNPKVDAAIMIHVIAGAAAPSGSIIAPSEGGMTTTSCEQYHIVVKGKGGHGAMPHLSVDPITVAAQIHLSLQEINSREMDPKEYAVFTTGKFQAGEVSNVIPENAHMWGTIRTADNDGKMTEFFHTRMTDISEGIAKAMRCEAGVEFFDFCPCLKIDDDLAKSCINSLKELLGQGVISMVPSPQAGSEDFAFVSHEVPSYAAYLVAGSTKDGYMVSQHNPKVKYDDSVLHFVAAAYIQMALGLL